METTLEEMLKCLGGYWRVSLQSKDGGWTLTLTDGDTVRAHTGENLLALVHEAHDADVP